MTCGSPALRPGSTKRRHVLAGSIERATARAGQSSVDPGVNAPWVSIKVTGRALPFVIDAQGELLDAATWDRVVLRRRRR